jgi:hypothetical protein
MSLFLGDVAEFLGIDLLYLNVVFGVLVPVRACARRRRVSWVYDDGSGENIS